MGTHRYAFALLLCACSPSAPANDAAQDAAAELAVQDTQADDATSLDAPSDAGPEAAVDAVPELGVDATPEATADAAEAGPPLPWVRDFGTDYGSDTVEVLYGRPGTAFRFELVRASGVQGRTGCSLASGLVQFAVTSAAVAPGPSDELSAALAPAGPGGMMYLNGDPYAAPAAATAQITRTRLYTASGVTRANYYVSIAIPSHIAGLLGRTADPTLGEFRLFGCPAM